MQMLFKLIEFLPCPAAYAEFTRSDFWISSTHQILSNDLNVERFKC